MPFRKLPDHIRKHPDVQDTWHHHHTEKIVDHENRLQRLEYGFHLSNLLGRSVKTPLGELPLPLAITAGGLLIWKYPDTVLRLLGQ